MPPATAQSELATARAEHAAQAALVAFAVGQALAAGATAASIAAVVQQYQAAAVALALSTTDAILAEQSIPATSTATVVPITLLTSRAAVTQMAQAAGSGGAARLVGSLVRDAARTARAVDIATRPKVSGYYRHIVPPSCGRCAILAGRFYRWTEPFYRHPQCDCVPTPTDLANGTELAIDPQDMFERGQIHGLSKADTEAINLGADIAQVVNVRRKQAGLTVGSSVLARGGRLTPAGILTRAKTRDEALKALAKYGYIRAASQASRSA